MNSIINITTRR